MWLGIRGIIIAPMGQHAIRGLLLLAGAVTLLCPQPTWAQVNPCTPGRLPSPYPTFAEEIRELNVGQPVLGFVVGDLQLVGEVHDRVAVRSRILKSLQKCFFENESDLLNFGADIEVPGYFQDNGYFEAKVSIEAKPLDIRNKLQRMLVIAHVQEGDQFRLRELTLVPSDPEEHNLKLGGSYLRSLVHIRTDEIMNAEEIRAGVQRISWNYGRFGYVDVAIEPSFDIDHANHTISIVMRITEGPQYIIDGMEIRGLSPKAEGKLRKLIRPGDLFNQSVIEMAIKPNIPAGSPCRLETVPFVVRNPQKKSLQLVFDFRSCNVESN